MFQKVKPNVTVQLHVRSREVSGEPALASGGAEGPEPRMKAQASLSDANFLKDADGNLST